MGWHLRALSKCVTCGRPAAEQLFNAVNAPLGVYCVRHCAAALREALGGRDLRLTPAVGRIAGNLADVGEDRAWKAQSR